MMKKFIIVGAIISFPFLCQCQGFAQDENQNIVKTPISTFNKENLKLIKNNELTNEFVKILTFSQNTTNPLKPDSSQIDYAKKYAEANEKFSQGNITAAYKDYKTLIMLMSNDDFVSLGFAYKFANIGLFSLAQEAINNIQDRELYNHQIQLIKSKLFPQVVISYDDELQLAESYTEIYYHNLAFEVARDMNKMPERLKRADYAHFILSQAYYNIQEYGKAVNEINKALSINPDNANYLKYKAQIFCETNKLSDAIKTLDYLLAQEVELFDYQNEINGLRYYTLAKAEKNRVKSKYYLAKYFIKTGSVQRAIKELNQNVAQDKKDYKSMTLLGEIYFSQNKISEALEMYEKSYKINKGYNDTLMDLANLYLYKKDYQKALDYYVKASKKDKKNAEALINASLCYKMLDMNDKSDEYANKAFTKEKISARTYYIASKIDEIKNIQYLKKTVSIDPLLFDAWLDLTDIAIKNKRLDLAKTYIKPVKYLNKENSRYYYYSGLINKQSGNKETAISDFKKALELDPLYVEAENELKLEL